MTVPKKGPGTPLPWYCRETAGNTQQMLSSEKTGDTVAVFYRGMQDADYAEHAANAYPKLVAALKLPLAWNAAFDGASGARKSDEGLFAHGWDGNCSPADFMVKYTTELLRSLDEL